MKQGVLTEHDAFIMGAKETIIEMISGQENSDKITEFILKEADDNQIMSLLLIQEMPSKVNDYTTTDDYNALVENEIICETQFFTNENYVQFVNEVGGLVDNFETVLESFLLEYDPTDRVQKLAQYSGNRLKSRPGGAGEGVGQTLAKAPEGLEKLRMQIGRMLGKVGKSAKSIPSNIWAHAKLAYQRAIKAGKAMPDAIRNAVRSVSTFIRKAGTAVKTGIKGFKTARAGGAGIGSSLKAGAKSGKIMKGVAGKVAGPTSSVEKSRALDKAIVTGQKKAAGVKAAVAAKAAPAETGAAKGAVASVKGAAGKAGSFVAKHSGKFGAAAGVALAAAASFKVYQRYFSAAAKACAGKSGEEKNACLVIARRKAVQARIASLRASMSKCAQASNPGKCKSDLAAKISSLSGKAA